MKNLLFICSLLFVNQLFSQDSPQSLPVMTDWFLSTGDWGNAPEIYVRELGSGSDTVIMLHGGWGGHHDGLIEAVKELVTDYRFILYDQRGSLRSPFPDSAITFDQHIEDLELLRKELKLEQMIIVGHSMGTILASAYAAKYPHRVAKLILLAPAYLKNPIPQESHQLLNQQREKHQEYMNRPEVTQELNRYHLNRKEPARSSKEETSLFRINFARRMLYDITNWSKLTGGRALYQGKVYGLTEATYPKEGWNFYANFKEASYPISIIVGDHDFLDFGNGLAKKWSPEVSRIQLQTIPKAGHIIWLDQPQLFTNALKKHLQN